MGRPAKRKTAREIVHSVLDDEVDPRIEIAKLMAYRDNIGVLATIVCADEGYGGNFFITDWFRQASDSDLIEVLRDKFMPIQPLEAKIFACMATVNSEIADLVASHQAQRVYIDEESAMHWLRFHRPCLLASRQESEMVDGVPIRRYVDSLPSAVDRAKTQGRKDLDRLKAKGLINRDNYLEWVEERAQSIVDDFCLPFETEVTHEGNYKTLSFQELMAHMLSYAESILK